MFLPNGVDLSPPEATGSYRHLRLRLLGSSDSARITSSDRTEGQSNYLLGADPSRWVRGVPNYSRIKYKAIYPGIDLVFYGNKNKLEHDFQLAAGANTSRIALQFEGAKGAHLTQAGDLQIHLENGILILDRPVGYQMTAAGRKPVHAAYVIASDGAIKFRIGRYDHTLPLVIDPALSYATYLDKQSLNVAAIAVDGAGSTYVTGITFSSSYPITSGAFQSTCKTCSSMGQPCL